MPFTPKNWQDSPTPSTPIQASALIDLETRLAAYTDASITGLVVRANNLGDVADVDAARFNLRITPLRDAQAVATANITTLSGLPTIDGYTLVAGDRVLLTGQTSGAQNGPWLAAAGAWTRPNDYPHAASIRGRTILITAGTLWNGTVWQLSSLGAFITVDTTSTIWSPIGRQAGAGLTLSSNTLAVLFGTTAGTAAQGNDARIAGALQAANNLTDLGSAAAARTALALGSAATQPSSAFDAAGAATAAASTKADASDVRFLPVFQSSHAYLAGQQIVQAGQVYAAKVNFTSSSSFSATNWNLLGAAATIPASVVDATGAPSGDVPIANGSGGYSWGPVAGGSSAARRTLIGLDSPPDFLAALTPAVAATRPSIVRLDYTRMGTLPVSDAAVSAVVAAGARPLIVFADYTVSAATIASLASRYASQGLTEVELGNEDSYGNASQAANVAVATAYANQVSAVAAALQGTGVGLIAQADDALVWGSSWVDTLYSTVPGIDKLVEGWVIHPYGAPGSAQDPVFRINQMIYQLAVHGNPLNKPIFITEYGISTDNGATLTGSNNFWPLNLTYKQAGIDLLTIFNLLIGEFPQIALFNIFQAVDQAVSGSTTDAQKFYGVIDHSFVPKAGIANVIAALSYEREPARMGFIEPYRGVGDPNQPAFQNAWTQSSLASFPQVAFAKDANSVVHMKGRAQHTTSVATVVITLPVGYRPSEGQNPGGGNVIVNPDGTVQPLAAATAIAFDGISFVAEQ